MSNQKRIGLEGTIKAYAGCSRIITTIQRAVVATVPIGGSDEVWYDPGTQHYFLAARNNLSGAGSLAPILGSIDAVSHQLDSSIPSSTTSHSVAADQNSHLVFLPAGFVPATSTTPDPNNPCPTTGCIAVYFSPFFAGTPGQANCHGKSVSALAGKFGDLTAAAAALGFPGVPALQNSIMTFCGG